jgi:hypothetical protein
MKIRRDDALRLARDARTLSKQVKKLTRLTNKQIAIQEEQARRVLSELPASQKKFDLEVKESIEHSDPAKPRRVVAAESKPVLQNYAELVAKYHASLAAYLQHRKDVQAHAAAFHAQAQQQNSQPISLEMPPAAPLELQAQYACVVMQSAEAGLRGEEESLNQAIQMMMNNRKALSSAQYAALWTQSEQRAAALQSGASNFDQSVAAKQQTIQGNLHGKMQEAMRDGDYVLSQKVYEDEQRASFLVHMEAKRANKHSQLAMQFLNQLQTLSPYQSQSASNGNPDQFIEDDKTLAAEFDEVQALYQQVQEAAPQFHK